MTERWLAFQKRCADWLRPRGYPAADHVGRGPRGARPGDRDRGPKRGDLLNVGDRIIECTTAPMSELADKLDQAATAAHHSGFAEFWVWKTARNWPMGGSYMISRASVVWPLLARLDRLEQWEAEISATTGEAYDHGYQDGLRALKESIRGRASG